MPLLSSRRLRPGSPLPVVALSAGLLLAPAAAFAGPKLPQHASRNQAVSWERYDAPDDFIEIDLPELENRLRETPTIGVLTKISLKHQVKDLLRCFGRFHSGDADVSAEELRARFDALFARLCSVLRRKDYVLYRDVLACEEQVWATLIDPAGFRTLMGEQSSNG